MSDGLEGFARSFLLAGFLVAGRDGADPGHLLETYARGLAAGTDPNSPEAWPRPNEVMQANVEAASIALVLQLTRPWLWDRLDSQGRERTVDWLSGVMGQPYPPNNWVWFRIVVESFLREVGGPWSATEIEEGLALHASMRRAGGWLSDGPDERSYDHYVGWALHVYPLLWTRLFNVPASLCPPTLREQWTADLGRYTDDVLHLTGADGSPLIQGRSLIYRFAAAAPLWMAALTGAGEHSPGQLRRAAAGIVSHFTRHGAPEPDGLLTLGWHGPWPQMRQSYSGPGSPYWASKGMLGLLLPPDHPVWTDVEQPLPVETGDITRVIKTPGWLVSARQRDGIVTVLNHGTDHARPGTSCPDLPLYAHLGYSTATMPPLTEPSATDAVDNTVVLLDEQGRASHRSGFRTLFTEELRDGALVAASQGPVHWVDSPREGAEGQAGTLIRGPVLTVASVVRHGIEVRLAQVDEATSAAVLRIGGWPLSSTEPLRTDAGTDGTHPFSATASDELRSSIRALHGLDDAGVTAQRGISPLAEHSATPWLTSHTVTPGEIVAAAVTLTRRSHDDPAPEVIATSLADGGHQITVIWKEGDPTDFTLPAYVQAAPARRKAQPRNPG